MEIFGHGLIIIRREREKVILGIVLLRIVSVVNILSLIQIINY